MNRRREHTLDRSTRPSLHLPGYGEPCGYEWRFGNACPMCWRKHAYVPLETNEEQLARHEAWCKREGYLSEDGHWTDKWLARRAR